MNHLKQTKPSTVAKCGQVDRWHSSRSWLRTFVCQLTDWGSALLSDQESASQIKLCIPTNMESFQRLKSLPFHSEDLSPLPLSEPAVLSALKRLNAMKEAGLNGVPNWLFKAYAGILACPVTAVLNSSFPEQRSPSTWKMVPVPKLKPVTDINKHLHPISLTSVISKLAKDCRRSPCRPCRPKGDWSKSIWWHPSLLQLTRPYAHLHTWLQPTDGPGTVVRVELFDYRKVLVFLSFIQLFIPSNFGVP